MNVEIMVAKVITRFIVSFPKTDDKGFIFLTQAFKLFFCCLKLHCRQWVFEFDLRKLLCLSFSIQ